MKNTLKLFGIIALVAVIGFSMAACGDIDSGGGGMTVKLNITNSSGQAVTHIRLNIENEASAVYDKDFAVAHGGNELLEFKINKSGSANLEIEATLADGNTVKTDGAFTCVDGRTYNVNIKYSEVSVKED